MKTIDNYVQELNAMFKFEDTSIRGITPQDRPIVTIFNGSIKAEGAVAPSWYATEELAVEATFKLLKEAANIAIEEGFDTIVWRKKPRIKSIATVSQSFDDVFLGKLYGCYLRIGFDKESK